jgi:16S rRNA (uracil1498-N3)-methyltransferase
LHMRNIVLDSASLLNDRVVVDGALYHYLRNVRRIREGGRIDAVIGNMRYSLVVSRILKGSIQFEIEHRRAVHEDLVRISVYQGLLKSKKMDLVVSKLGEMGVSGFFPMKTRRSVSQINLEGERLSRWRRLAREGAKVSGFEEVMDVHDPLNTEEAARVLKEGAKEKDKEAVLLFSTDACGEPLPCILSKLNEDEIRSFHLLFGPEGDFSENEISLFTGSGAHAVTMGDFILKAETASIVGTGYIRISCT